MTDGGKDVFDVDLSFSDSEEEDVQAKEELPTKSNLQYGTQEPTPALGKSAPTLESTTDIDHYNFKPIFFFKTLVNEKSIDEILDYSNQLTDRIKELDSEMQNLVYENYANFIDATDTVREMKTKVETMEEEMEKLTTNMEKISKSTSELESRFNPNRQKIEKLVRVRRLLKRLEFLFELPKRLRHSIQIEAYGQAVKYFTTASSILDQYRDKKSFEDIFNDANLIVSDLITKLRTKVKTGSERDQLDSAKLLKDLKVPLAPLKQDILGSAKKKFEMVLVKCEKAYDAESDELPLILRLTEHFVAPFVSFGRRFREVFVDSDSGVSGEQSLVELTEFSKELFAEYFSVVKRSDPHLLTSNRDYLQQFYESMVGPDNVVPDAKIRDCAAEIVELGIRTAISLSFKNVQTAVRSLYVQFLTDISADITIPNFKDKLKTLSHDICNIIADVLLKAQNLQQLGSVLSGRTLEIAFIDYILQQLKELMHYLYLVLTGTSVFITEGENNVHTPSERRADPISKEIEIEPLHLLLLSKVCYQLADRVVPNVVRTFKELFAKNYSNQRKKSGFQHMAQSYEHELRHMSVFCKNSAVALRTRFLERMTISVIATLDDKEGEDLGDLVEECRPMIQNIEKMFLNVLAILRCVYEIPSEITHHEPSNTSSHYRSDFDKLFGSKSSIFGTIRDQPGDVLAGVIKATLKAWSEIIRGKLLTKDIYAQIKKETNRLKRRIPSIVPEDDFTDIESLLDEVVSSAAKRTMDMDENVL